MLPVGLEAQNKRSHTYLHFNDSVVTSLLSFYLYVIVNTLYSHQRAPQFNAGVHLFVTGLLRWSNWAVKCYKTRDMQVEFVTMNIAFFPSSLQYILIIKEI